MLADAKADVAEIPMFRVKTPLQSAIQSSSVIATCNSRRPQRRSRRLF